VSASPPTPDTTDTLAAKWLIGRLSEHRELLMRLDEQPGLLVLEADPLSGTSTLLAHALDHLDRPHVAIDARKLADALDLGMAIADEAVAKFAPSATAWWNSLSVPYDSEGLRLSRTLSTQGIDLENLRTGSGAGLEQLRHALELVSALAAGPVLVAIDHLDTLLDRLSARDATELLGVLRADRQREHAAQLLLVGLTAGRLASAMRDRRHPLYRAGDILALHRADPQRFADDMAIGRPWSPEPTAVVRAAAELANGAPAYVWRIVELSADFHGHETEDRVLKGWRRLCEIGEPLAAGQFALLASAHRAAPTIVSAIASGLGPYESPIADKSVHDALRRMRARGAVFSPARHRWAVSDPLLAHWARQHAPIWVQRRARASGAGKAIG
jgi:hypothetical protein